MLGVLGAFIFMVAFAGGFAAGVYAQKRIAELRKPDPVEAPETELSKVKQEQEAFTAMQGYTVDMAYGLDAKFPGDKG
jgi:hypothetical protein